MIRKATAKSPANIAFIKYWGKADNKLTIPNNNSISMNIDRCYTITTVEFSPKYKNDEVKIKFFGEDFRKVSGSQFDRVINHVNRFRRLNNCRLKVKILSENSFPSDAGIAASASAFSALTKALIASFQMKVSQRELSIWTRLAGSGSACRSVIDGFAEWKAGKDNNSSYAIQLAPENYWPLADLVVVVKNEKKEFSSLHGHALAQTSPFYPKRQQLLKKRTRLVKKAIKERDLILLGKCIEEEAVEMHMIAMTAKQPIFYWNEGTMEVIRFLYQIRKKDLFGFFTIDAGPNVHIICHQKDIEKINRRVKRLKNVIFTIKNKPCVGSRLIKKHLF
jgi:diphosphomevalonate decarboxylase